MGVKSNGIVLLVSSAAKPPNSVLRSVSVPAHNNVFGVSNVATGCAANVKRLMMILMTRTGSESKKRIKKN